MNVLVGVPFLVEGKLGARFPGPPFNRIPLHCVCRRHRRILAAVASAKTLGTRVG